MPRAHVIQPNGGKIDGFRGNESRQESDTDTNMELDSIVLTTYVTTGWGSLL